MELSAEVFGPSLCLGNDCDLKIRDAEPRNMALLLVVGRVRLDLLGDPRVRHRADVCLQKEMPFVLLRTRLPTAERKVRVGLNGKFSVAWCLHAIPQCRLIVLPIDKFRGTVSREEQQFGVNGRDKQRVGDVEVLPFSFPLAPVRKLIGRVSSFDERRHALWPEYIQAFVRARLQALEIAFIAEPREPAF